MVQTDSEGRRLYKARGPDGEVAWVDHEELWRLQQTQAQELRRGQARRRRGALLALAGLVAIALVLVLVRLQRPAAPESAVEHPAAVDVEHGARPGREGGAGGAAALPAAPADPPDAAASEQVAAAVSLWAEAWERRDMAAYLASYGAGFAPPDGASRTSWERLRRQRLTAPDWIRVEIDELRIALLDDGRAEARFRQSYRSPLYADVVRKSLELVREADGWRIVAERAEPLEASG